MNNFKSDAQKNRLVDSNNVFESYKQSYKTIHCETFAYSLNILNGRSAKPETKKECGIEKSNTKTPVVSTIKEFIHNVTVEGRTWSPFIFDGFGVKKDNSIQTQIFALDFDHGVKYQRVLEVCEFYGITPTAIYTTFSHTEAHHKFRVLWFCITNFRVSEDNLVYVPELRSELEWYKDIEKDLVNMFQMSLKSETLFDETGEQYKDVCDDACVGDIQRTYFGGLAAVFVDASKIYVVDQLENALMPVRITKDKGQTRNAILENKEFVFNGGQQIRNTEFSFEELAQRFKIFNDFHNCKWLDYNTLGGLATNLEYFEGGNKYFLNKLEEIQSKGLSRYTSEQFLNVKNHSKYATAQRKKGHQPHSLKNFSPYQEDHLYLNMLQKTRKKNLIIARNLNIIENAKYNHIEAVRAAQNEILEFFINIGEHKYIQKVLIFIGDCGIGKTHIATQFAGLSNDNFGLNSALYFKRYNIINEKYKLTQSHKDFVGMEFIEQPKKPVFSTNLEIQINALYANKEFQKASELIRDIASMEKTKKNSNLHSDIDSAADYQTRLDAFEDADRSIYKNYTALATHNRLINKPLDKHIQIADECIEPACLNQVEFNFKTLIDFENNLEDKDKSNYKDFLNSLKGDNLKTKHGIFDSKFKRIISKCKKYCRDNKFRNLYDFFNSKAYTYQEYMKNDMLNVKIVGAWYKAPVIRDNQKLVILSATPNIEFYKKMYGEENVLIVEQQTRVKYGATVKQNTNYSYAKSAMTPNVELDTESSKRVYNTHKNMIQNLENVIKEFNKESECICITYKGFDKDKKYKAFNDILELNNIKTIVKGESLYFGNLDGMDVAKHTNAIILGTYSINPEALKRKTLLLHPELDIEKLNADKTKGQECSDKDFELFYYNTYTIPELREQHLYFTRDAQIQAFYRSRPLTANKDCLVYMLSKYPIKGTTIQNRF